MNIRKHIPNFITCLNLFSGCIACVMAFNGDFWYAALFIYLAAVLDFLDGFAARALHAYSSIGKELDSLADCISFGMAPGLILFSLLGNVSFPSQMPECWTTYIPYLGFLIPVFSALRLAKFNVDERQTTSFIGLPTPANTIFWASFACNLPVIFQQYGLLLLLLILIFSYLLVSEFPMFSLKIKNLKWKDNSLIFIFLGLSLLILIFLGIKYLYAVILLYILMSAVTVLFCNKQEKK